MWNLLKDFQILITRIREKTFRNYNKNSRENFQELFIQFHVVSSHKRSNMFPLVQAFLIFI